MTSDITVTPLTLARWDLVSTLFASASGVDECWCMWPRRARGMHTPGKEANRAAMRKILESGESPGLIAVAGDRAVGWCAIAPRERYPQYEQASDKGASWAIPCIYIEPKADRERVARALIEAAIGLASAHDAVAVEGPPPYWLPGDEAAIEKARITFLENGFEQVGEGARMPELRRLLRRR